MEKEEIDYLKFLLDTLESAKNSLKMEAFTNDKLNRQNRKQAIECINIVQNALNEDLEELNNEQN